MTRPARKPGLYIYWTNYGPFYRYSTPAIREKNFGKDILFRFCLPSQSTALSSGFIASRSFISPGLNVWEPTENSSGEYLWMTDLTKGAGQGFGPLTDIGFHLSAIQSVGFDWRGFRLHASFSLLTLLFLY